MGSGGHLPLLTFEFYEKESDGVAKKSLETIKALFFD
jgi:hypothetical protein